MIQEQADWSKLGVQKQNKKEGVLKLKQISCFERSWLPATIHMTQVTHLKFEQIFNLAID